MMKKFRKFPLVLAIVFMMNMVVPAYAAGFNHGGPVDGGPPQTGWGDPDPWFPEHPQPSQPTDPEEPEDPVEIANDGLNFYINLAGDVLDTQGNASHYGSSLFTDALTDEYELEGINLLTDVRASSYYTESSYDYEGIAGEDVDDYENIDAEIRSILSDHISFPTDGTILSNVKSQIENGANINDINGNRVSSTLVSDEYYDVFWYVLKEGNSHWHVDGILRVKDTPEVTTYNVTYTWDNAPDGVTLPEGTTYADGDTVEVDKVYNCGYEVPDDGGKWVFNGWDHDDFTINCDVEIHGSWYFMPNGGLPSTTKVYNVTINYLLDIDGSELQDPYTETNDTQVTVNVEEHVPATITKNGVTYDLDHIDYGTWVDNVNGGTHESTAWYTVHVDPDPVFYNVTYTWTNAPSGIDLPASATYKAGSTVTVDSTFGKAMQITRTEGVYEFNGWMTNDVTDFADGYAIGSFAINNNVTITGSWTFEAAPTPPASKTYTVSYSWTEPDNGPGLPEDAHPLAPATYTEGDKVTIDTRYDGLNVYVTGGYYKFLGWCTTDNVTFDATGKSFNITNDIAFVGSWMWFDKTPKHYTITIEYYDIDTDQKIHDDHTIINTNTGVLYDITDKIDITIDGYTYSHYTNDDNKDLIGDFASDMTFKSYYTKETPENPDKPNPEPEDPTPEETPQPDPTPSTTKKYVYVTVNYVDENGNQIHDDYTLKIRKNRSYDVNDQVFKTIEFNGETYEFSRTTGALLETNCCPNNVTIIAHYEKVVTPVEPEPEEPTNPTPEEPTNPTPEEPTNPTPEEPTNPTPEEPVNPDPIPEPPKPEEPIKDVPELDDTPKTGDPSTVGLMGMLSSLAGLTFLNRKRKEDK